MKCHYFQIWLADNHRGRACIYLVTRIKMVKTFHLAGSRAWNTGWFRRKVKYFGRWRYGWLWEKVHKNICLILIGHRNRAVRIYIYKSVVNGNIERKIAYCWFYINFNLLFKWQICYTEMTLLTVYNWYSKSHRETQCPLKLVCKDRVLFVWADLYVSLCEQQHPKRERAIHLAYPPLFSNLRFSSSPAKEI